MVIKCRKKEKNGKYKYVENRSIKQKIPSLNTSVGKSTLIKFLLILKLFGNSTMQRVFQLQDFIQTLNIIISNGYLPGYQIHCSRIFIHIDFDDCIIHF